MGFFQQLKRDIRFTLTAVKMQRRLKVMGPDNPRTIADLIDEWATSQPDAEAIVFEGRSYSYAEYNAAANRWAQWGRSIGLMQGDVVALFMEDRPEFLFCWLGMAKLGVVSALINTKLRAEALAHCINIAKPKLIITGAELSEGIASGDGLIQPKVPVWAEGGAIDGAKDVNAALDAQPADPVGREARPDLVGRDILFYIYTSGTTGLPKAARFTHTRFMSGIGAFSMGAGAKKGARVYVCLPLYHSAGGVAAIGQALFVGGTIILKRKFSATEFWQDCREHRVTQFQYIGELCRYLLNTPVQAGETDHVVESCIGNGLRPDVWGPFQERFKIPRIVEIYAATEGNASMMNLDGYPGAVGRIPPFLKGSYNYLKLLKFDVETEMPIRSDDGFCIECDTGEAGELVGKITDEPGRTFEGYESKEATDKKILRDVFEKGDAWFRTGDLLRQDKRGYMYFVDRIGDTFRWKGENVSTAEVAEIIDTFPGIHEANVYGVEVPGADGRAGMASLVGADDLDLDAFAQFVVEKLPVYAKPMFIRLSPEMETTGTFKHRKVDLVRDGFDPRTIDEPLYFFDKLASVYVPLDQALYEKIISGAIKL